MLIILILLISCTTFQQPKNNIIIEGKSIGMTKLGEKKHESFLDSKIEYVVNNDSIIIELFTKNSEFVTSKGIKNGDLVSKVYQVYGNNFHNLSLDKGNMRVGEIKNLIIYKNIKFLIRNDTVNTISIY